MTGAAADRKSSDGGSVASALPPKVRSGVQEAVGAVTSAGLPDQVKHGAHAAADKLADAAERGRDLTSHGAGVASHGIERARSAAKSTISS